jgi:hypothetical protein
LLEGDADDLVRRGGARQRARRGLERGGAAARLLDPVTCGLERPLAAGSLGKEDRDQRGEHDPGSHHAERGSVRDSLRIDRGDGPRTPTDEHVGRR